MKPRNLAAAAAAIWTLTAPAQATLFDRGGGMIYDSTLNITWLSDWNYAQTSGHDADGLMTWDDANTWANNLVYGGYGDWRLPAALNVDGSGPCREVDCTGSEIGHLFYTDWGASAWDDFSSGTNATNLGLFTHVQSYIYWSGTEYAPFPSDAWIFATDLGYQIPQDKSLVFHAVAVRPGDVAAVPEAQTWAMLLLGLGAVTLAARQRAG